MKLASHRSSTLGRAQHRRQIGRAATLALLWLTTADAQLRLPTLPTTSGLPTAQLPTPIDTVTRELGNTVNAVATSLNSAAQTTLRATTVRNLIRDNRATLEADPNGAAMLRNQLMALNPTADALARALAAGFSVVEDRTLEGLDTRIVVLSAPSGLSTRRALQRLRTLDANGRYDFNHLYLESGAVANPASTISPPPPINNTANNAAATDVKIGLIDSGVEATHAVFRNSMIHVWGAPCSDQPVPSAHGTAVASLLIGTNEKFHGAAAGATLYAVDVYCGNPAGGSVNNIAAALAWLATQQVPVINISLVGPANVLLEHLVRNLIARGHVIVAAVGNDGPAAAPLYPAAYPDVIGVTAVDARHRVLVEAERGAQVDFAAPGADMAAAALNDSYVAVRGTSFAAPIVAGLLATCMHQLTPAAADQALAQLNLQAQDLGAKGPDKIYGRGLVGDSVRVPPETLAIQQAGYAR
jgi:subtilisin family serine protease